MGNAILSTIFLLAVAARIASVVVSRRHVARLRAGGAVEHGALNSRILAGTHGLFYLAAFADGLYRGPDLDTISALGVAILLCSLAMLVWIVRILGPVWTVKIMIAPDHSVNRHALFRHIRHPNYFLNILPELVGYAMVFHAWWTLLVGLPIYLVILAVRIVQEERAMKGLL